VAELAVSHIRGARTTLIFVNNRGQAERMAARINALAGEELARPYHGSLQRVGRAGHSLGESSRGVFVPTFRDDLLEMAAIIEAMREGEVEPTRVPQNALDVVAQILVAMASVDDWAVSDAFALVRRAYPYHRLARAAF